jgi:hypothetical protein
VIFVKFHRLPGSPPPITLVKKCRAQRLGFFKYFFLSSGHPSHFLYIFHLPRMLLLNVRQSLHLFKVFEKQILLGKYPSYPGITKITKVNFLMNFVRPHLQERTFGPVLINCFVLFVTLELSFCIQLTCWWLSISILDVCNVITTFIWFYRGEE